jgi:four helix bundle protein
MDETELKKRTKQFALRVIKLAESLPGNFIARIISSQLVRAGTSVGANYRAACRARSQAEFISKLGIVEEEADESCYWMELITEDALVAPGRIQPLLTEANEILAIISASRRTAKRNAS